MPKPASGRRVISHGLASRALVAKSSEIRKIAEAEPETIPTNAAKASQKPKYCAISLPFTRRDLAQSKSRKQKIKLIAK